MRKSLKKLLSFVLVIGIMAGSFIFAMPALADSGVVLETNGGTLASTDPIEAGANLPTYEGITREGCTFGGWFTDANFTGAQSFVAAANTTYYARWVAPTVLQDFESLDASTYASTFTTYKYNPQGTNVATSLDTSSDNAYSGNNSACVYNIDWAAYDDKCFHIEDDVFGTDFANVDTGYYFWVSANVDVKISVYIPWFSVSTYTIPAGTKQLISVNKATPWENGKFRIIFHKALTSRATVHIDDIGTFTDVPYTPPVVEVPAAYETNGGTFNADYTVPTAAGATLPTYENITREGCVFGGWYTKADFSGKQQFVIENNTKYYARWIDYNINGTGFEDATDVTTKFTIYGGNSCSGEINTNAANAYEGSKSLMLKESWNPFTHVETGMKYGIGMLYKDGGYKIWDDAANIEEGYAFWISTNKETTIRLLTNWWNSLVCELTIPEGKHIITIPGTAALNNFRLATVNAENRTVYIDAIGTYTTVPYVAPTPVTLNTNGGTLADPDHEYFAQDTLPTEITKANAIFTGWYDNAELTGTPVTVAQNDGVYYASWIEDIKVIDSFESGFAAPWKEFDISGNAITSLTVADGALKVVTKNICKEAVVGYSGDEFDAICYDKNLGTTITSEGIYAVVRTEYEAEIRFTINPNDNSTWGKNDHNYHKKGLTPGTHYVKIPWSAFGGEAFGHDDVSKLGFSIKGIWSRNASLIGTLYIEEFGVYGVEVKPSYGIATPGAAGLFSAVQSENSGIVITPNSAVYEVGGTKYTAFRVFGTYVAPDKNGAPDFGKVVVGEGDVREIVSRHVMLGYKTTPTLEKNYVMTNATGNFDKCWSYEQNPDGSWKVTYSLLLKDIPEEYAATAFNVKSAIVTAAGTIDSDEMVEGVSAKAIYDKIEGEKPVWFN